ncbi:flagellar filament capping protein FliD [Paenibacillus typhae]|uniref:Flagellar hook-associated protein 2 n=1 Tax=Paenibacillus typhae TaxID=1174501 RepID=A0A1G8NCD9_9BACL|nr:flagellar filament capping protein FliD [Paenibacillus typhae]SDI77924.1 flagellar hook-associated protein 2 [Paenibacillus typhae]
MAIRVSGMSSGLDVESIVKEMMNARRQPLTKLNQDKTILEWQRDNYREINSKLVDFRNNKLLAKYDNSASMITQKAVVTGNTSALKAESTSDANGIPMTMEIIKLAKPATVETAGMNLAGSSTRLTAGSKLSDFQKANNITAPADGKYKITLNGDTLELDANLTINEALAKINKSEKGNVTAKFDEVTGKLTIASKTYSDKGKVEMGTSDNFLSLFGSGTVSKPAYQAAEVKINGSDKMTFASNTFKINGINVTLLAENTTATINTETDTSKAVETVKSFIQDYNDLLNTLTTKVNEERYKDFTPLTDEQKQAMKENDIELWEKKAKSGLLRNDDVLKSTISSMRAAVMEQLGALSNVGVTTGLYYENGKLILDEDKLKQAFENNPQGTAAIFQGTASQGGLFDKISSEINGTLDKLVLKAGTSKYSTDLTVAYKTESTMGKRLKDFNTRIANLTDRLTDIENNYYKKFTAMETAMSQYNSQSASLGSLFTS